MSGSSTALDLRWPIGGLFTALGLLLTGYGMATAGMPAHYAAIRLGEHQPLVGAGHARCSGSCCCWAHGESAEKGPRAGRSEP